MSFCTFLPSNDGTSRGRIWQILTWQNKKVAILCLSSKRFDTVLIVLNCEIEKSESH